MAVQSMNFFEQHAGKLFLALVCIIAAVLCWIYAFGDSVTVDVQGQSATPAKIEQDLKARSGRLAEGIKEGAPPVGDVIDTKPGLADFDPGRPSQSVQTLLARGDLGAPLPPTIAVAEGKVYTPTIIDLSKAAPLLGAPRGPAPGSGPLTDQGRNLNANGKDVVWVAVSARVPYDSIRAFRDNLVAQEARFLADQVPSVLLVRLQRMEVDPNGNPVSAPVNVAAFGNNLLFPLPAYPGDADQAKLTEWSQTLKERLARIGEPGFQGWIRRPKFYFDLPKPLADERRIKQEWEETIARLIREHPEANSGNGPELNPNNPPPPTPDGNKPPDANRPPDIMDGGGAPAQGPQPNPVPGAVPVPGPGVPVVIPKPGDPPPPADPSKDNHIWIHAFDETARPGRAYVYRIQVVLLNPLLNIQMAKGDQDHQVEIPMPWSAWSAPVWIERDVYIFLSRSTSLSNPVQMTVYKYEQGQLNRESFGNVSPGEPVGDKRLSPIFDPKTGEVARKAEIDYATGLIPVEVRKLDGGSVGREDYQVLFLDPQGRLVRRLLSADERDPKVAQLDARYEAQKQPPREEAPAAVEPAPGPGVVPPQPGPGEMPPGPGPEQPTQPKGPDWINNPTP
ncbi:MAG: hypothetical protein BIFFINMI_04103 [Phycisphaerae bacterium]|nr:hypothetical protein [Phycisphaerae bacterium]